MTGTQSSFFRFILFLMGAGILILAFILINHGRELSGKDTFMWASIAVMYLFFFVPFFFSAINAAGFSGKIPSYTLIWTGIFLYLPASIAVILLLQFSLVSLKAALIIQAVFCFLFFLNVYFGYFASSHVRNVAAGEAGKTRFLVKMKNSAASLALKAGMLGSAHEPLGQALKVVMEDIRYLSPVDGEKSAELDVKILNALENLSRFCDSAMEGGTPAGFDVEIKKLWMLIRERKLLRN
jgi:hypothetical protein